MPKPTRFVALLFGLFFLSGCDLIHNPTAEGPSESPAPSPETSQLIAQRSIFSGSSINQDHLADIEMWMDYDATRPRIVLKAALDLEYFELHLALPSCYVFPRPHREMSGWRGNRLPAGEQVEISSRWIKISDGCDGDYATVLWNLASRHQGSKSKLTMVWTWTEDD